MWFVAAGVAVAAWLALLAACAVATRPRFGDPLPATMDIGPEPPAVASYLVHRWHLGSDAIPATVLDLAGRNLVDIEQIAPAKYILRPRPLGADAALTAYERRVWNHLTSKCENGVVPAGALDLGVGSRAKSWTDGFRKEVIADAQARGLSQPRWSTRLTVLILGAAVVPAALFGIAADALPRDAGEDSPAWAVLGASWFAFAWLFHRLRSQRDTADGRAAAARWLGLRDYLSQNPAFADMSPAAEAIWDRYLAYAAAFGLARNAVRSLPIRAEDPDSAWSAYGGRWRVVRLRWRSGILRPGTGMPPALALLIGTVAVAIGGTLAWKLGPLVNGEALPELRSRVASNGWSTLTILGAVLIGVVNLIVAVVLIEGLLLLARALPDLVGRQDVVGEILRVRSVTNDDKTTWYVVLDDGRSADIPVWRVSAQIAGAAREGTEMRATIAPRLGHVYALTPTGAEPA